MCKKCDSLMSQLQNTELQLIDARKKLQKYEIECDTVSELIDVAFSEENVTVNGIFYKIERSIVDKILKQFKAR